MDGRTNAQMDGHTDDMKTLPNGERSKKVNGKGLVLDAALLQTWKWQLIGMS